jgi:hypothetical protein
MGVDIHLERGTARARIQKRTVTFPRLKLRVRAPSPAAIASFDRVRLSLDCSLSSLKVELIPLSQLVSESIEVLPRRRLHFSSRAATKPESRSEPPPWPRMGPCLRPTTGERKSPTTGSSTSRWRLDQSRCGVGVDTRSRNSSRREHVTPKENVVTLDADHTRP